MVTQLQSPDKSKLVYRSQRRTDVRQYRTVSINRLD